MNERIRELIEQATTEEHDGFRYFDKKKFAELIVRECAELCERKDSYLSAQILKEHFGVE